MTYVLYGASLAFAWFVCINLLTSALVAAGARRATLAVRLQRPATRARILFGLRLAPSAAALAFTIAVFVPSFVRYEPRNFDEAFGVTTMSLVGLACVAGFAAVWRGVSAIAAVDRRVRACLRLAAPVTVESIRAFRVDASTAAMTLVGVLKPRLLVTQPLLDLLAPDELRAAYAHERGHQRSRDNLKRLAMRSAPDLLAWSKASRLLEREWSTAAEHAADDHAVLEIGGGLPLASALVKIARFGAGDFAASLGSPLVGGDSLRSRVERLVHPPPPRTARPGLRIAAWTAVVLVTAAAAVEYPSTLAAVHAATEMLVHRLP
jgi:Zn-dependent protease with chaperone function